MGVYINADCQQSVCFPYWLPSVHIFVALSRDIHCGFLVSTCQMEPFEQICFFVVVVVVFFSKNHTGDFQASRVPMVAMQSGIQWNAVLDSKQAGRSTQNILRRDNQWRSCLSHWTWPHLLRKRWFPKEPIYLWHMYEFTWCLNAFARILAQTNLVLPCESLLEAAITISETWTKVGLPTVCRQLWVSACEPAVWGPLQDSARSPTGIHTLMWLLVCSRIPLVIKMPKSFCACTKQGAPNSEFLGMTKTRILAN